jgi:hypothetical protein
MPDILMNPRSSGAFVAFVLLATMLSGCHRVLCRDTPGQSFVSSDGKYVATVVQSDCGAGEHATVVEVRRNRALLRDRRSVFVIEGFQQVNVAWQGKHQLQVSAPTCDGGKTRMWNWNDVTVQCEVLAKNGGK